ELSIIKLAVKNHGLIKINEGLSERELLFSKIARDADKLDIYKIVCEYYMQTESRNPALELGLDIDKGISKKILNDFINKKVIEKSDMQSLDDFRVLQLSWIFDIYFDYTRKQVYENKFTHIIVESIRTKENIDKIKNVIDSVINLKQ
ncbi:MAG: hypothetical protein GX879_09860, partial [Bacteroidales bacterium]|nr:hypothetical protein [Bacteroidales bacterium]